MQINRIEVRLGATINAGDFQSVKAEVMAQADVERNEDPMAAYAALSTFVREALVNGAQTAHPDAVRKMLKADARLAEAATDNKKVAEVEKAKPGRPKKDAAPKEAPKLADTSGMNVGGLDKEDELSNLGEETKSGDDDLDALLGDTTEEAVSRDDVQAALVQVVKKAGKPAVLELLKKFGAANLGQLPDDKFAAAKKEADKIIAAHS